MAAVFGVAEDFAGFGERGLRDAGAVADRTFFGEEVRFGPVFPRFERQAVNFGGEAHAEAFFQVQTDEQHARSAREVRAVLPERAVRGLIGLADSQRFDDYTPNGSIGFSPM